MIKFSKWLYELGYRNGYEKAIHNALKTVDDIPLSTIGNIDKERKMFKSHMHQKFDPNYKKEVDIDNIDLLPYPQRKR